MSTSEPISVLLLAASPVGAQALALTREFEDIHEELRIRCPGQFVIAQRFHVKSTDLPGLVMQHRPQVLHFSGHGQSDGELVFEDADGYASATNTRVIARVFELLTGSVCCVVLNACYSEAQARLIAQHVDVVIGMSDRIRDTDARRFAKGFYEALSFGQSVGNAFELATLGISLDGSDGQDMPRLHARAGVHPQRLFVRRAPTDATADALEEASGTPLPPKVLYRRLSDRFEQQSIQPRATASIGSPKIERVDVLIVTALRLELDALREVTAGRVEAWHEVSGEHPFWLASFEGEQGLIHVAAARLTEMGGVATALVAQKLSERLLPASLAMCGVCAGHPEDTDRGDVIIADRVFQHDFGKQKVGSFQGDLWTHAAARRWSYVAQELEGPAVGLYGYAEAREEEARWWILDKLLKEQGVIHDPLRSIALRRYVPDGRRAEILARFEDELGEIRLVRGTYELTDAGSKTIQRHRARHGTLVERCPYYIHVGPIGSGNKVEADGQVWGRLADGGIRKILGVEMEAATIGAVAADLGLPFAVVKGVMDHADPKKSDRYKTFASRASAEVLLHFLRLVVSPSQGWTRTGSGGAATGRDGTGDDHGSAPSGSGEGPSSHPKLRYSDIPASRFENDESIRQRLEVLRTERKRRSLTGQDVSKLDHEILALRREQRSGPPLGSGELLAGRFELVEQIGRGGFANVWKAWDPIEGRPVAIKLLRWDQSQDRSVVERFYGGARQQASLRHPAVVAVLAGPVEDAQGHFFVMPWLVRGDLRRAIEDGPLERAAALEVVARALEGLAAAHQRGWVHRDVKPANILIDTDGLGYMADFDLVRAADTTRATRTAAGMGTFAYAAPEQLQEAKHVDARADVYAAAMTVLFVLAGKNPPPLVLLTEPHYIDGLGCGYKLAGALRGALAYRPDERTTTCAELIKALREPDWVRGEEVTAVVSGQVTEAISGEHLSVARGHWINISTLAKKLRVSRDRIDQIIALLGLHDSNFHRKVDSDGNELYSSAAASLISRELRSRGYNPFSTDHSDDVIEVEVVLPKVGLKANAPAGTTVREMMGNDLAVGPDLVVTVEKGDKKPKTGDEAIKDVDMYTPKDPKVQTLADGYVLTFTNEGGMGTNYWVNARREISGVAYWCTSTASTQRHSDAAVAFCKSLRKWG